MFKIPLLTSDILALSLDGPSSPSINIHLPQKVEGSHSRGWGFGWYPGDRQSAMVAKDPVARDTQVLTDALTDWAIFRSTVFFCKVRGADKGYTQTETQPFSRSFAGRDWMFLHNGDLDKAELEKLHGQTTRLLEPLGTTDSELAFCNLLAQVEEGDARQISDIAPETLLSWFQRFDALGSSDMYLTDGRSIVCFHGSRSPKTLYHGRLEPPENQGTYESEAAHLTLKDPRDAFRTAFIATSSPFAQGAWTPMRPGQMIVARRGAVVWDSHGAGAVAGHGVMPPMALAPSSADIGVRAPVQAEQAQTNAPLANPRAVTRPAYGKALAFRLYDVTHTSHYEYETPVEHSTHIFRLQPVADAIQDIVHSSLTISSSSEEIQYEDVFGNQTVHCTIDTPYTKLSVTANSLVKVFASLADDHSLSRRQTSIPLVWMPWQRQMMMPYLLPSELPESQLYELTEYAMSFVERNDHHLLKTVEDINLSIYRDFKYVPGSTALGTTPFDVYMSRQGVCQDFANLFICLTRLLSIPARYRMGYIHTGTNYANTIQSEASHAWAEVYLPYVGWRGFDPTNGCSVAQDHIRVACGRNYRDATPTSGTIFKGGGKETMSVGVKVRQLSGSV